MGGGSWGGRKSLAAATTRCQVWLLFFPRSDYSIQHWHYLVDENKGRIPLRVNLGYMQLPHQSVFLISLSVNLTTPPPHWYSSSRYALCPHTQLVNSGHGHDMDSHQDVRADSCVTQNAATHTWYSQWMSPCRETKPWLHTGTGTGMGFELLFLKFCTHGPECTEQGFLHHGFHTYAI